MKLKFLALSFCFIIAINAQTSVPGGNVSGLWTLSGSPYLVNGNILVPDNATLTIEPGVVIEFQGHYKLFCNGRILALGTATDTIIFTVPIANRSTGWYGIKYDNTPTSNGTSVFRNCKIEYGNANGLTTNDEHGGAFFFNNYSKCIIDSCTIINNFASNGGGAISGYNSSPGISNNYFDNNMSGQGGNGIELNISSSSIHNNIMKGSGIYIYSATANISNNCISGSKQGAVTCFTCNLVISNNTFERNINENGAGGGGILAYNSFVNIVNNIIRHNYASTCGGAITLFDNSGNTRSVISNNLIYKNSNGGSGGGAGIGGGAIFCANNSPRIVNNTICDNLSQTFGGGIYCTNHSSPVVQDCILFDNYSKSIIENIYLDDNFSDPSFYYNNIQGGLAGINTNGNPLTGSYSNNIDASPGFINQADSNYELNLNSPCIDAGDPAASSTLPVPAEDIAGNLRIVNGRIDIGAYEMQGTVPVKLLFFTAKRSGNGSLLSWQTSSEYGCKEFQIEKSTDGINFYMIGAVPSSRNANGNKYEVPDNKPATGINYYRLKTIDNNGHYEYSNICLLSFNSTRKLSVYPNPVRSNLFIESNFTGQVLYIKLTDLAGKEFIKKEEQNKERIDLLLSGLSAGIYMLSVSDGSQVEIKKIVKN